MSQIDPDLHLDYRLFRPYMAVRLVELATASSPYTAIVTGGCAGMGAELAKRLVTSGASVVLGCTGADEMRRFEAVKRIAESAPNPTSQVVEAWELDLASLGSTRQFAEKYHARFPGSLELLVNNAGEFNPETPISPRFHPQ